MRAVLALFEGVATGAADGYGRMTGRPAATLLHLGPGLGNGMANLHNARRARTPLVNIVGDHATYHLRSTRRSTPTSTSLARTGLGLGPRRSATPMRLAADAGRRRWPPPMGPPGGVATLVRAGRRVVDRDRRRARPAAARAGVTAR